MPSGLELYPHNEKAYRKLLAMLSETRRACIIHPTGTGKAFIAYRYAFDHPKERILWMSPSTYIEQEQEASIRRELPNYEFKNIERMTYQTAMHRAQKGNLDIHADTVIFDEFHHTGAPQWSRGVEGVIECNPDANLIGLSATSIRSNWRRETCKTWESAVQREDRSHQMSLKEKRDTVSRRVSLNEINHDFDVR